MKIKTLWVLVCSVMLLACSSQSAETELTVEDLNVFAEGELYEGSNTAQCEFKSPLKAFLKEKGIDVEQLESASVSACQLSVADSTNLNVYSSVSVQLTSEKEGMQNVGIMNPVPENVNQIQIKTAEQQENILELLKQDQLFVVADANIKQDTAMNIELKCKMIFKIKYKTK